MENLTTSKQKDILNTQNNTEETPNKNYPIIEREQVPKTPFWLIKQNEKWFLIMGEVRITELKETKQEALDELTENKWFITMSMAAIVLEKMLAEKKYWKQDPTERNFL